MSRPLDNGSNSNNDPSTDLASLITQVGTTWGVKSQPSEPCFRVFIDIKNIITSCDCLGFISARIPCIHMCMLKWYNKGVILAHSNQPTHVAPQFVPPHQQPLQQAPPVQPMPQPQSVQQTQPVQQPPPLPQQPQNRIPIQSKPSHTFSIAEPLPSRRRRPRNDFAILSKRLRNQDKLQGNLPKTPAQPPIPSTTQPAGRTGNPAASPSVSQTVNPFRNIHPAAPQQASPVQQPSPLQSPTTSAIQEQLQLQLTRHLQQQRPSVQVKTPQKQPEQTKDIDKLIGLLTELNKKYETIRPSCSTSPLSLPPNMNSDIVLRGKKIALEAQTAMRNGVVGKELENFIMTMLERERTDIVSKPSFSSTSTANASSSSTSSTPIKSTAPAKAAATTAAAAIAATNASSPISINSGPSTPTTSSPLARNATSSPARRGVVQVNSTVIASKPPSPAINAPSTSIAPAPVPSTLSPVASPPKVATASVNPFAPKANTSTATASTLTAAAPLTSASSSPEASSSAAGKRRRALPAFAISDFLRTKQEIKPEKKCVKSEGYSSQRKSYPVVEPIEGYDAAITRMINNMKNEKNSSFDPWSISSSSEDEEDDSD